MPTAPRRLRWFQFRLRSLLIVTCVVGAWLGWEVRQADSLRRHVNAVVALGGQVELEASAWSLLRFVDRQRFGLRAAKAEIPAAALAEVIPHLQALPGPRELRVVCDGACDLYPHLDQLTTALAGTQVRLVGESTWPAEQKWQRFLAKLEERSVANDSGLSDLATCLKARENSSRLLPVLDGGRDGYHIVPLPDGSIGELLVLADYDYSGRCEEARVILLVRDIFVDAKPLWVVKAADSVDTILCVYGHAVVDDLDGDGFLDVGFEVLNQRSHLARVLELIKLPGDTRTWNCVYRIQRDGLHPMRADQMSP